MRVSLCISENNQTFINTNEQLEENKQKISEARVLGEGNDDLLLKVSTAQKNSTTDENLAIGKAKVPMLDLSPFRNANNQGIQLNFQDATKN